jgi:hypothetical protein
MTVTAEQLRLDRVVIEAAVAALFAQRARVRRIQAVPTHEHDEWLREGRMSIQASHCTNAPLVRMARGRTVRAA